MVKFLLLSDLDNQLPPFAVAYFLKKVQVNYLFKYLCSFIEFFVAAFYLSTGSENSDIFTLKYAMK